MIGAVTDACLVRGLTNQRTRCCLCLLPGHLIRAEEELGQRNRVRHRADRPGAWWNMVKLRSRCLLVGDAAVGKSALCHMFHSEGVHFQRCYNMTAGAEVFTKCVTIPESAHSVELYLMDCPGREPLAEACKGIRGEAWLLCLVFDLSNEQSFLSCGRWLEKVQTHCLGNNVSGVLVGNKRDLVGRRAVQLDQAQDWAQTHGLVYYETSAKELDSCMAPVLRLAQICLSLYEQSCERTLNL